MQEKWSENPKRPLKKKKKSLGKHEGINRLMFYVKKLNGVIFDQ